MSGIVTYSTAGMRPVFILLAAALACLMPAGAGAEDAWAEQRARLVDLIEQDVRETSAWLKRSQLNPRVLDAMRSVPRHEFVPPDQRRKAYQNRPLPIGHGQTISQPYIVAIMTDLLDLEPGQSVLEIGTGSGYQAAVLAALEMRVFSIEIIEPLALEGQQRLRRLGYDSIRLKTGDGYYGWAEHGPFDAIIVTAAAGHIPPPLVRQLRVGGRMIIPVGSRFSTQELILITRTSEDEITTRQVLPVRFVPLTGKH